MLRCVTEDNQSLIATYCEEMSTRTLSRTDKLFCRNCRGTVTFNKGKVKLPYFSHKSVECEYVGSEPETADHLKGKALLYDWLQQKFPKASVEYEVYQPQTGQITDIYVEHENGEFAGQTWAFEFQHSNISAADWESRHNLYESVGIQDFWFFDKKKFMKYSKARDHTDARLRSELEKKVFNTTGFVYFLDLDSSEVSIDFGFTNHPSSNLFNGRWRTQEYIYHEPQEHSVFLSFLKARKSVNFDYSALVCDTLEAQMEIRLKYVASLLIEKHRKESQTRYKAQLKILLRLSNEMFGDEFEKRLRSMLLDVSGGLTYRDWDIDEESARPDTDLADFREDILNLDAEEFLLKHRQLVDVSLRNVQEYQELLESEDVTLRVLTKETYPSKLKEVGFLKQQKTSSLKDFLRAQHHDKVILVEYVWENHRDCLDDLAKCHKDFVHEKLSKINSNLKTWDEKPTSLEYAMQYRRLKSKEEIEECVQQIKDNILKYDPFSDIDWEL